MAGTNGVTFLAPAKDTRTLFAQDFEERFKVTPLQAIAEFRTEVNPEATLKEYVEFYELEESVTGSTYAEILGCEDDFDEWKDQAQDALDTYQQTIVERDEIRDTDAEIDWRSPFKPESFRDTYSAKVTYFAVDHLFLNAQPLPSTERKLIDVDKTSGPTEVTVVLTEFGLYNPEVTRKSHQAWLRMRETIRKGTRYIGVGSIQINMETGVAECGVSGCGMRAQLLHARPEAVALSKITGIPVETDREHLEYQVLRILQHLGTHRRNDDGYPFPAIASVSRERTGTDSKIVSHVENCTNSRCRARHHVLFTDGWDALEKKVNSQRNRVNNGL